MDLVETLGINSDDRLSVKREMTGLAGKRADAPACRRIGQEGEDYAAEYLQSLGYRLFERNYRYRHREIDLIMVHEKGIFVFESKNYSGYIFGKANEQNWVQKMENGSKHVFYNPIKQNNTHIIALANYLSLPISAFTSYIIFSERCELTKVPKNAKQVVILQRNKMLKNIRKELKERKVIYTKEQIKQFERKLKPLTNVSNKVKKQHIEDIKQKYETNVCPFCGKKLIKRAGKYGEFMGCTGYPKCKYTTQIQGKLTNNKIRI